MTITLTRADLAVAMNYFRAGLVRDLVTGNVKIDPATLPTSSKGLKAGSLWNDGGIIAIVLVAGD